MVPEIQLTVVTRSADLHFFVWLQPVQPEQCRYQRNALTPTFLTYIPAAVCAGCPENQSAHADDLNERTAGVQCGQASERGPRLVIWSAMIARCTSLVPSQMRSTRSSRKNRSATFSRM